MKNPLPRILSLLILLPFMAACSVAQPAGLTATPTHTRPAVSPSATPATFRSDAYHFAVSLPPGWTSAERPERLAEPFDGLAAFNSFGRQGFFAKEVASPDETRFTYSPRTVLDQIPEAGAYIVLVHQSGGPAQPHGSSEPEYEQQDLGGLWKVDDCRTGRGQAGASLFDFFKWGRRLRLEVYCGPAASDETIQEVKALLESWRFDPTPPVDLNGARPAAAPDTPTPDTRTWNTYTHPTSGVSLRYPPGWNGEPAATSIGPDGLFVMQDLGTFGVFTLEQICTAEAGPAAPGDERPPFERTLLNGDEACLTRSFTNPPYEMATLVVAHPTGGGEMQFVGLMADLDHLPAIASTLRWPEGIAEATAAHLPEATGAISLNYPSGLTIEAYQTGHGELLTSPDLLDSGFQPIPNGAGEKRLTYRKPDATEAGVNASLATFGYRLEDGELTRREEVMQEGLRALGPVSTNRTGDNFILGLRKEDYTKFLLDKDGLHEWNGMLPPVYLGDDLLTLEMSSDWKAEIQRGGKPFYSGAAIPHPAGGVYELYTWDDHWAVETTGSVLVDGKAVNAAQSYEESFGLHLLGGRPFYLFQKDSRIDAWYDGEVIPLGFDQVIHYACCSGAPLTLRGNEVMTWFYARKAGQWFFVEIGVYPTGG